MDYKDYEELTKLWQGKMQEFWRDPKVVGAMVDGYANAFKGMQATNTTAEHNQGSTPGGNDNENEEQPQNSTSTEGGNESKSDDVHVGLRDAVFELSLRVAELEREVLQLKAQLAHAGQQTARSKRLAANARTSKACS